MFVWCLGSLPQDERSNQIEDLSLELNTPQILRAYKDKKS